MADSACLPGDTAAAHSGDDVELAGGFGHAERLVDDELEGIEPEVLIGRLAVNREDAGAGIKANARNRLFTSAGAVEIRLCTGIHICFFLSRP